MRQNLMMFALLFSLSFVISGCHAQSNEQQKPNVIILLADDLGWADVGYRGSDIKTPNLDQLASEGMRLERFYTNPICTPTRAALMTARDPMKLGVAYAGLQPWEGGGVSLLEHFMPESFQAAGYETAMIGKWHLGKSIEQHTPNARGFDHFVGHLNTQVDYFTHGVAGGYDLQENGKSISRKDRYLTDVHAEEAVRFIAEVRDTSKPFFLYVPFLAPHSPMQATDADKAKYPDRPDRPAPKKTYAAMVDNMDQAIGKILASVKSEGLEENTIILFLSDNGGYQPFGADNQPLRGGKLSSYEGGIRVNAVISWPGEINAGVENNNVISAQDVMPTLFAATGVERASDRPIDGQNRWAAIKNNAPDVRTGPLFFASNSPIYNRFHVSVIDGDSKLVQVIDHANTSTTVNSELFNLASDPYEKNDLSGEQPAEVERLATMINQWRAQHPVGGQLVSIAPHPGWRAPKD